MFDDYLAFLTMNDILSSDVMVEEMATSTDE